MTDAEQQAPVFGPNGAVLNSATMTDELRAQYAAHQEPPRKRDLLVFICGLVCVPLLGWLEPRQIAGGWLLIGLLLPPLIALIVVMMIDFARYGNWLDICQVASMSALCAGLLFDTSLWLVLALALIGIAIPTTILMLRYLFLPRL
ncbi:MAG TPA: hypothetical protein EYG02_02360 [Henriciella marina]|uniref:hypothetical protein n=1 Tax=Henriciella sp. TaxID=1968823 RepID=UPI0018095360|nr:hypothetical protein [Henriciella sp.]HIG21548.1 hypothetical protein [Henriciella sp.]HIK63855.1 hypothetical protein [Henriciella marina]